MWRRSANSLEKAARAAGVPAANSSFPQAKALSQRARMEKKADKAI
jgi:hypothetical protein